MRSRMLEPEGRQRLVGLQHIFGSLLLSCASSMYPWLGKFAYDQRERAWVLERVVGGNRSDGELEVRLSIEWRGVWQNVR